MTNADYTAVMLLVDRSGSMAVIQESAEAAINEFVRGQAAEPGKRTIRIAQFDDRYEPVHESLPAADCPRYRLGARGMTALLDAMARSIREFGDELAALDEAERPATVIYAVMTDGAENVSCDHTWDEVKRMVRHQEHVYGWQILYLGAHADTWATAEGLGIHRDRVIQYSHTDHGTRAVTNSLSGYVVTASSGLDAAFDDVDREEAMKP